MSQQGLHGDERPSGSGATGKRKRERSDSAAKVSSNRDGEDERRRGKSKSKVRRAKKTTQKLVAKRSGKESASNNDEPIGGEAVEGTPSVKKPKQPQHVKTKDYGDEIKEYLSAWANQSNGAPWKFSKKFQTVAIDQSLDKDKLDSDSFKTLLLPYLQSVTGSARDRLVALVEKALADLDGSDSKDALKSSSQKRAIKIKKTLGF
jgi:WKF domain